jgi:hypothetical protein
MPPRKGSKKKTTKAVAKSPPPPTPPSPVPEEPNDVAPEQERQLEQQPADVPMEPPAEPIEAEHTTAVEAAEQKIKNVAEAAGDDVEKESKLSMEERKAKMEQLRAKMVCSIALNFITVYLINISALRLKQTAHPSLTKRPKQKHQLGTLRG